MSYAIKDYFKDKRKLGNDWHCLPLHHRFGAVPCWTNKETGDILFKYRDEWIKPEELYKRLKKEWQPVLEEDIVYKEHKLKSYLRL